MLAVFTQNVMFVSDTHFLLLCRKGHCFGIVFGFKATNYIRIGTVKLKTLCYVSSDQSELIITVSGLVLVLKVKEINQE